MTTALEIWNRWCSANKVAETGVSLFACDDEGGVKTKTIGKTSPRSIIQRHASMDAALLYATDMLLEDWKSKRHRYDGLIYMMFRTSDAGQVIPLYIGKAETFGKGDGNLSANLTNLHRDRSKFARWGDNYAYHIGDLSAAVLPGHPPDKINRKYKAWGQALFEEVQVEAPRLKQPIFFWTKAWKPTDLSVWGDLTPTRLAFLEYLLIGVASTAFQAQLLNYEGHNRHLKLEENVDQ